NISLDIVYALVWTAVALVVFWRKSDDWVAMFMSLLGVLIGTAAYPVTSTMQALALSQPGWGPPVRFLNSLTLVAALTSFYIFPDGRFIPRWTRLMALFLLVYGLL